MAGTVQLTIKTQSFLSAMREIKRRTGFELGAIMRDVMALWAKDLINKTPPFGLTAAARKQGETRVYKDITHVIYAIEDNKAQEYEDWFAASGGTVIGHAFKTKAGAVFGTDSFNWSEDQDEIAKRHARYRSKTTGRITRAGAFTRNIGRWKFLNRLVTTASARTQYINKIIQHVGKTKSGWLAGWSHFNSLASKYIKTSTNIIDRMDWILRHGTMNGTFKDTFDTVRMTGSASMTNRIPWIRNTRIAAMMKSTARTRLRDLSPNAQGEIRFVQRLEKAMNKGGELSLQQSTAQIRLLSEMLGKVA